MLSAKSIRSRSAGYRLISSRFRDPRSLLRRFSRSFDNFSHVIFTNVCPDSAYKTVDRISLILKIINKYFLLLIIKKLLLYY